MIVSKNWLKDYIDFDQSFDKLAEDLTMIGLESTCVQTLSEIKDKTFELEITSNRSDWLSFIGIAREIAALNGSKVSYPDIYSLKSTKKLSGFKIEIHDKERCPFYSGILIKGVKPVVSPQEVQNKLKAIGLQPINLLVDLTNIVLFEMGQPMHAFDFDKIQGEVISIRRARAKEKFISIGGSEYELSKADLVIADKSGAIALAGIKGGQSTEVSGTTQNIILESAYFQPKFVRQSSRRLQLSSDSSYRFERRVDLGAVRSAQLRYLYLLDKYAGFESVSQFILDGSDKTPSKTVSFTLWEVEDLLGIRIGKSKIDQILKRLGFELMATNKKELVKVKVPTFRHDVSCKEDLLEEVLRLNGYDMVPETFPRNLVMPKVTERPTLKLEKKLHELSVSSGFQEIVPFTLIDESKVSGFLSDEEKFIRIVNPQNKDLALLRPSMVPGMLEVISHNLHSDNKELKLYEIGNVYLKPRSQKNPAESKKAIFALTGGKTRRWYANPKEYDFYDLKGYLDLLVKNYSLDVSYAKHSHPSFEQAVCFGVYSGKVMIGVFGKVQSKLLSRYSIEQDVYVLEIDIEEMTKLYKRDIEFKAYSRYPTVKRDIAVIVDQQVLSQDLESTIYEVGKGYITKVDLFDHFSGGKHLPKGKKNVAFLMDFNSLERTLDGEEVQKIYDAVFQQLQTKYGAVFKEG